MACRVWGSRAENMEQLKVKMRAIEQTSSARRRKNEGYNSGRVFLDEAGNGREHEFSRNEPVPPHLRDPHSRVARLPPSQGGFSSTAPPHGGF